MDNFNILRKAAKITYGGIGEWLFDEWKRHNEKYFGGDLRPGGIVLVPTTSHGGCVGNYNAAFNVIRLHESALFPKGTNPWGRSVERFGKRYASDVLLHEMIHQHLHQKHREQYREYSIQNGNHSSHNNPLWIAEINRIGKLMNLEFEATEVKVRRDKETGKVTRKPMPGNLSRKEIAVFPQSLRSPDYYLQG